MVSPATLGVLKETVPELLPVRLEPGALCTRTGAAPLRPTVAPLPLAGGLIVPEMASVPEANNEAPARATFGAC